MLECLRKLYYRFGKLSQTGEVIQAFTGFLGFTAKFGWPETISRAVPVFPRIGKRNRFKR